MNDSIDDSRRILGFPEEFFWETLRSVIFGLSAVIATYLIFQPIEAQRAFDSEAKRLSIRYAEKQQALELEYRIFVQRKVFERRIVVVDDFIVNSDAYTKTAFNVFESEALTAIDNYKEDAYNAYQMAFARLHAAFGPSLDPSIAEARQKSSELFELYKKMIQKKTIQKEYQVWKLAYKALVNANIAVTEAALKIQYSDEDSQ